MDGGALKVCDTNTTDTEKVRERKQGCKTQEFTNKLLRAPVHNNIGSSCFNRCKIYPVSMEILNKKC